VILEFTAGILAAGGLAWACLEERGRTDGTKIQKIAKYSGLIKRSDKETHTIHLLARRKREWGNEFVYRIPLGFSFDDFLEKRKKFEDGLNLKVHLWDNIQISRLLKLKWDKTLLLQLRKIANEPRPRKEVIMDYDGALIIRVYRTPMPKEINVTIEDLDECKGWKVWIGTDRSGEKIYLDFEKRPHVIIAGATGFGKSEIVKLIITILTHIQPDNIKFHLADLKGGTELGRFKDMRQVLDFERRPDETEAMLERVKNDMEETLDWLYDNGFNSVKQAGIKERHFVIIDEAADIANKIKCVSLVTDIARRGRSAGYRLIYATQYPTNETLPSQVRANVGNRIVFRLETGAQSLASLDEKGAESLPEIEGRAIFRQVTNKIVQTPLIDDTLINQVVKVNLKARKEDFKREEPKKRATSGRDTIIIKKA